MSVRNITLALAMLFVCFGLRAADDPVMGTWKLNVAKSKFTAAPPKSIIRKHEPTPNGIKVTSSTVAADGKPSHFEFTANFDGKYYAVTGGGNRNEMSLKRIDPYTVETMNKMGGKETTRSRWSVSKDGKTLSNKIDGTLADGKPLHNIMVYDKQ